VIRFFLGEQIVDFFFVGVVICQCRVNLAYAYMAHGFGNFVWIHPEALPSDDALYGHAGAGDQWLAALNAGMSPDQCSNVNRSCRHLAHTSKA